MGRIASNCHTHTQFCDGKNTMEEMLLSALSKGFVSLGFTPHGRQHFGFQYSMSAENERAYFEEFTRLNKQYGDQIRLYWGVERDFLACTDCGEYDYVIGSVHYLSTDKGLMTVDSSKESSLSLLEDEFLGDSFALARAYYHQVSAMVTAVHPTILGHFDLFLKNLRDRTDTSCAAYRKLVEHTLEDVFNAGCVMELNTGGMARSNQPLPYPEPFALSRWQSMGGKIIVSSDCHRAEQIDTHFDEMPQYLRAAGFETALRLNPGEGALFEPFDL